MQNPGQIVSHYNFRRSTRRSQQALFQIKKQCKIPNQLKNQAYIPEHLRNQIQNIEFLSQKNLNQISYQVAGPTYQSDLSFQENLKMMHIAAQRQEQNYKLLMLQKNIKNIPSKNIKSTWANPKKTQNQASQSTIPSCQRSLENRMVDENFTLEKQNIVEQLQSIHLQNSQMDLFNGKDSQFFGNHNLRGHVDFQGDLFVNHDQKHCFGVMETQVEPQYNIIPSNLYYDARDFEGLF